MPVIQVAALFVEANGVYSGLPGVELWPRERDARKYPGPHRVIAHPPCERYGRYHAGRIGDDGGCMHAAAWAVRTFGGVLEQPEGSHAWAMLGIPKPPRNGGWIPVVNIHGRTTGPYARPARAWTCCVEQGHYGHPARKATWLYYIGDEAPPDLIWGPSTFKPTRRMLEAVTEEEKRRARKTGVVQNLSAKQRRATPPAFAAILLSLARLIRQKEAA